ncbi:homoserine kinase [Nonlabens sp. Hel1_33_55]|uniref:homoserine kinase n=1 Tax=Nonlabens sp. Hel1_33_55 TaxID=1336802 RepID=UPI000875D652|nr:homoserine kinase [Nonlabens sp. Hel1_33_55]SCY17715.1 homoserine kinase [Nonlabens sp. Hel1_33_55]
MKKVTAFAPATIANFNVGFDFLGVALQGIGDEVTMSFNQTESNVITDIENGADLPKEASRNCCSVVVRCMQEQLNDFTGVDIHIKKGFASGSGLGSSSASSAAAAFAYNELLGKPFTNKQLVYFAAQGEKAACGSPHVDNVAPSIIGGMVMQKASDKTDFISLPILPDLYAVLLYPQIVVKTSESRSILKETMAVKTASQQIGYMGSFVASLYLQDMDLFKAAMKDVIIEPMRSMLIPKFDEMKQAVLGKGALAFGISGSGPSVFTIVKGQQMTETIKTTLEEIYSKTDVDFKIYISPINADSGATIL